MNSKMHSSAADHDPLVDTQSITRSEIAHHIFDMRVHASIMMVGALLAGYCGFRVVDIADILESGSSGMGGLSSVAISLGILLVFLTVAGFCLFEAHHCWKRAAVTGARNNRHILVAATIAHLPGGRSGPQTFPNFQGAVSRLRHFRGTLLFGSAKLFAH